MLGGGVQALLVAGADPFSVTARQTSLEFLAVHELFMTATAQQADVVLPALAPGERDGTYTNLERRVQHFDPALPAPGVARPDWAILRHLAVKLGAEWSYANSGAILEEMAQLIPLYAGMSYTRLSEPVPLSRRMSHYIYAGMSYQAQTGDDSPPGKPGDFAACCSREGLQWPTLAEEATHTFVLRYEEPSVQPAPGQSDVLMLTAPRVLYDDGTMIGQAAILGPHIVAPHVALSPDDAARLRVADGDRVTVRAYARQVTLPCRVDAGLPAGVAAIPRNLAGHPAEVLLGETQLTGVATIVPMHAPHPVQGTLS
jgi:predicted molibdopterin-dependent oxidoreductase YjgC